jgi:methylmalonyl-CoA mutase cobalamin-binding subunit
MKELDLSKILPRDLPSGAELVKQGKQIANEFEMGVSMLCEAHGVRSEFEYKKLMRKNGRIMTTMDIGYKTWPDTADALRWIHAESEKRGFRIDRFHLITERRLGLPESLWEVAPKETGPMLYTNKDWWEVAHTVPIQPHCGDYMIGSPASVRNTCNALKAGITYIGNVAQYSWKYPYWQDDLAQVMETVKAMGIMAGKKDDGAMCHTYLDDGYGAQFDDFTSYIGFAKLQRYIVEDLIGANLSIVYGGLTDNPIAKSAVILALESCTPSEVINAYYHGNTTLYTKEIDRNLAVLATDLLFLIMTQLRVDSGAAVFPISVMEAIRVPTVAEILQAQTITRRLAEEAPNLMKYVDWGKIEEIRDRLISGGEQFFQNTIQGFSDMGVDIKDPLQILLVMRHMGGAMLEESFGVGEKDDSYLRGHKPEIPSDTYLAREARRSVVVGNVQRIHEKQTSTKLKMVTASTDVHEYGIYLVNEALKAMQVEIVDCGVDGADPEELVAAAIETAADGIVISTHNGMALRYATRLYEEMTKFNLKLPVFMGGVLNEDVEGYESPLSVVDGLKGLGVVTCVEIEDLATEFKNIFSFSKNE